MSDPDRIVSMKALHLTMLKQIAARDKVRESSLIEGIRVSEVKKIDKLLQTPIGAKPLGVSYEDNRPLKKAHDTFREAVRSQIPVLIGSEFVAEENIHGDKRYSLTSSTKSRFLKITEAGKQYLSQLESEITSVGAHSAALSRTTSIDRAI